MPAMLLQQIPPRLRRVLFGLLAGLVAVAALPLLNLTPLRDQLVADTQVSLGRRIEVGALRFALLPRPSITLESVMLYEPDGKTVFARFGAGRFSLGWNALLRGRAELVDGRVEEAYARVFRRDDGSLSLDDLFDHHPRSDRIDWHLSRVDLVNAAVDWHDRTAAPIRLSRMTVRAVDGEPGVLSAEGRVAGTNWNGTLTLTSALRFDRSRWQMGLQDFKLAINSETQEWRGGRFVLAGEARLAFRPWQVQVQAARAEAGAQRGEQLWRFSFDTPALRIGPAGLQTGATQATFSIKRPRSELAGHFSLDQLSADANGSLVAERARFNVRLMDEVQNAMLDLESPLRFESWQRLRLPHFTLQGGYRHKALPRGAIQAVLSGEVLVDLARERLDWSSVGTLDGATMKSQFSLEDFLSPRYAFGVDLERLDLTPYLPVAGEGVQQVAGQPLAGEWLASLTARGDLRLGELDIGRFRILNLNAHLEAERGRYTLAPLSAEIYGGRLVGTLHADLRQTPQFKLAQRLSGMRVSALLADTLGVGRIEGDGDLDLDLRASGQTLQALRTSLDGRLLVSLSRGAIAGVDVSDLLLRLRNNIARAGGGFSLAADTRRRTRFSDLRASFQIKAGVARNDDLRIRSPVLNLGGVGSFDLRQNTVNYTLRAEAVGAGIPELAFLKGVVVPIQISGPLASPNYRIDTSGLVARPSSEKVKP
jgi:hypothetical protein